LRKELRAKRRLPFSTPILCAIRRRFFSLTQSQFS
jgi:hypothetical protein